MGVEMRDVAPGLWLWRQPHPAWEEGGDWEPEVASFVVESRGEVVLIDSMAEVAGSAWRPEYTRAWSEALNVVAGTMLEGARV